jgi:hypothetical protein
MTLADLKARLAELGEERRIAECELESLRLHEREIADLERDRDALPGELRRHIAGGSRLAHTGAAPQPLQEVRLGGHSPL